MSSYRNPVQCQPCQPMVCMPCYYPAQASYPQPQVVEEVIPSKKPQPIVKKEYIPYERKVVEYVEEQVEERVPVVKKVIVNESRTVSDRVPVQRKYTDFVRVQVSRRFQPTQISEDRIERVPVTKVIQRPIYIPIERQILHLAEDVLRANPQLSFPNATGSEIRFSKIDALKTAFGQQNSQSVTNFRQGGESRPLVSSQTNESQLLMSPLNNARLSIRPIVQESNFLGERLSHPRQQASYLKDDSGRKTAERSVLDSPVGSTPGTRRGISLNFSRSEQK